MKVRTDGGKLEDVMPKLESYSCSGPQNNKSAAFLRAYARNPKSKFRERCEDHRFKARIIFVLGTSNQNVSSISRLPTYDSLEGQSWKYIAL